MDKSTEQAPNGVFLPGAPPLLTEPEPGLRRKILAHSPTMMLVRHEMEKNWRGAAHSHPHEQMVYVISGSIGVIVNGVSFNASAGDSFIVAPNAEHQAWALQDSLVLDVFTPARADYL